MAGRSVSGYDWLVNVGRFSANRAFILPIPGNNTAHWPGIENSLGDYLAVADPLEDGVSKIPEMLEKAVSGFDVVFAVNSLKPKQSLAYRCSSIIFNRSYSGLNNLAGEYIGAKLKLKHEMTELALIDVQMSLKNIGITLMDGSFFSVMPFPSRQLYTLRHVRYTTHCHWADQSSRNPYDKLKIMLMCQDAKG